MLYVVRKKSEFMALERYQAFVQFFACFNGKNLVEYGISEAFDTNFNNPFIFQSTQTSDQPTMRYNRRAKFELCVKFWHFFKISPQLRIEIDKRISFQFNCIDSIWIQREKQDYIMFTHFRVFETRVRSLNILALCLFVWISTL